MNDIELSYDITFDEFNFLEYHLRNGIEFSDSYDGEKVASFGVDLKDGYRLFIDVINSETEQGGAWVDTPLYKQKKDNYGGEYWEEVLLPEISDTLTEVIILFEDEFYRITPNIVDSK